MRSGAESGPVASSPSISTLWQPHFQRCHRQPTIGELENGLAVLQDETRRQVDLVEYQAQLAVIAAEYRQRIAPARIRLGWCRVTRSHDRR